MCINCICHVLLQDRQTVFDTTHALVLKEKVFMISQQLFVLAKKLSQACHMVRALALSYKGGGEVLENAVK